MAEFFLFAIFLGSLVIMLGLSVRLITKRRQARARELAMSGPFIVTTGRHEQPQGIGAYQIHPTYQHDFSNANTVAYPFTTTNGYQYQTNTNGFPVVGGQGTFVQSTNGGNVAVNSYQMETAGGMVHFNPPTYEQVMTGQYQKPQSANPTVSSVC